MHKAGMAILAGTDAPNPGVWFGVSLVEEIERLHEAGLDVATALSAATSQPAAVFGLADRGRIAAGRRADLVLVEGDLSRESELQQLHAKARTVWRTGVVVRRSQ